MEPTEEQYQDVLRYYERAMDGHVHIRETVDTFLETLGAWLEEGDPPNCILELGSHAGFITSRIRERWPHVPVLICEDDESLVAMSRRRLADETVAYHSGALRDVSAKVDVAVSVARHHHLPHDYLSELRRIMSNDGIYIVADELCPEYCFGDAATRIAKAETLDVVGGYLLTTATEVEAHRSNGAIPARAEELEKLRRRALWRWYRYVVDEAVERGYFDIAVGELQSTHDDLITGSDAEHKFSPLVVEKQFELAGFRMLSKQLIGPSDDAARQSMFVYVFEPA